MQVRGRARRGKAQLGRVWGVGYGAAARRIIGGHVGWSVTSQWAARRMARAWWRSAWCLRGARSAGPDSVQRGAASGGPGLAGGEKKCPLLGRAGVRSCGQSRYKIFIFTKMLSSGAVWRGAVRGGVAGDDAGWGGVGSTAPHSISRLSAAQQRRQHSAAQNARAAQPSAPHS